MKILSLGWGVQSFTLAAMVALGELEQIDAAIHADTTHESSLTYAFAKRWTGWLKSHGLKMVTLRDETAVPIDRYGGVMIPAYILNPTQGKFGRQCTNNWKRAPIRRWLQLNRNNKPVEQWLGISLDEFQRMKDSDVKYITNRWPLIELKMKRSDCVKWLEGRGLEVPSKSACTFCPFRNTDEWRITNNNPIDWAEAVWVDAEIRNARPPWPLFVHPSRRPLTEIDFRTEQEKGQLNLWDEECTGICGV